MEVSEEGVSMKSPKDNPIHFPPDRGLHVWIRRPIVGTTVVLVVLVLGLAWVQYLVSGLPHLAVASPDPGQESLTFPAWLRVTHYVNLLFIILLMRSGLSILVDHPRLYLNDHCTPGTEWMRLTPVVIAPGQVRQAKEDARYLSPWVSLPGYRHTIGMARHWHFLPALFWFLNGLIYFTLLFGTGEWGRLIPDSLDVVPQAWAAFVHYATLHLPPEPDPLTHYNALQQLSYFGVVFILAPLSFLTGMAMSPSIVSRFPWYPRIFGGRQSARSIHFLLLLGYIGFLVMHVTMVVATGFARNMNHIVIGTDDGGLRGVVIGLIGLSVVALACLLAHWMAWNHPRVPQSLARLVHLGVMRRLLFRHIAPRARYSREDISPYFWPNGRVPDSQEWKELAADDFRGFRLKVHGLVRNPVELPMDEIRELGRQEQITMHHCIQGWSGIAQWRGVPLARLIDMVEPLPEARVLVFRSFGEGLYGGEYYDTQRIENVLHPQCILAYQMNDQPLGHLYGAPLRLRVENQLGYKMVKWIKSIEFVVSEEEVGKGHGGKNEDDEYFDLIPDI